MILNLSSFYCIYTKKLYLFYLFTYFLNLNYFYSIFAKKRNSHGLFNYIKKHKIIHIGIVVMLLKLCILPKNIYLLSVFHCVTSLLIKNFIIFSLPAACSKLIQHQEKIQKGDADFNRIHTRRSAYTIKGR